MHTHTSNTQAPTKNQRHSGGGWKIRGPTTIPPPYPHSRTAPSSIASLTYMYTYLHTHPHTHTANIVIMAAHASMRHRRPLPESSTLTSGSTHTHTSPPPTAQEEDEIQTKTTQRWPQQQHHHHHHPDTHTHTHTQADGEEAAAFLPRLRGLLLGTDRWTGLLAALWAMLFLALFVNKQELWVVLAGLVAYACFCFLLDVVAIPPFWDGPLKANQTARLSNGLVCIAHSIATGLAALLGASPLLKLTMTCGFLLFDLWDKTWKRLYTSPPYRYTRGIPYAMQGATTLVLSITGTYMSTSHTHTHSRIQRERERERETPHVCLSPLLHSFLRSFLPPFPNTHHKSTTCTHTLSLPH